MLRWDDPRNPPPLTWWQHALVGFLVGFAVAYLIFVP